MNFTPPSEHSRERSDVAQDDVIDLGAIVATLWRGKLWIALVVVISVLIGGFYAFFMAVPIYRSTAVVVLDSRQQQVAGLDAVLGGLSGDSSVVNTEVEVLRARGLIEQVVQKLNLTEDPEFNTDLQPPGLKSRVRSLLHLPGSTPATDPSEQDVLDGTVDGVLGVMTVRNVPQSLVFQITIESVSPRKAALIADTLAEHYIENQIKVKFEATEQATQWLSDRVVELQQALETAEGKVQDFKSNTDLVDSESLALMDKQLKDTRDRIDSVAQTVSTTTDRLASLQAAQGRDAQAAVANDQILNRALARVQNDQSGVAGSDFDALFALILTRAQTDMTRATEQLAALRSSAVELEAQIQRQSNDLITLQQLTREADSSRQIYEFFLARLKETSVQQGIQQADSRVLSSAVVPSAPSAPRKSLIMALSLILGFMVGIALVLLREARQNTYRSAREAEQGTGLTVMGQIPLIPVKSRDKALEYLIAKPSSGAAEAVRNLRTSILLSNVDLPPRVIVTSSALPGEGKTTTALALAQNITAMGKKVIVVEGDLRRRVFGRYFSLKSDKGIMAVLSGAAQLDEAVNHVPNVGDVLIGEASNTNAADVFASAAFAGLVDTMRSRYDYVIIDTPPVLVVPDARVIAQQADAIVFVVRWDSTSKSQVDDALSMFRTVNLKVTGLVLSQISAAGMKRYGYGGKYGAYSSYGKKYYLD